jgi:hypothetical protein
MGHDLSDRRFLHELAEGLPGAGLIGAEEREDLGSKR